MSAPLRALAVENLGEVVVEKVDEEGWKPNYIIGPNLAKSCSYFVERSMTKETAWSFVRRDT